MRTKIVIVFLLLSSTAFAGTYYVSPTGEAAWGTSAGQCGNVSTGRDTPCSKDTANSEAVAGDTVIFLDGTYLSSGGINPTNSGTVGNVITWKSENKHGAIITISSYWGITLLNGTDYHVFDGFYIKPQGGTSWVRTDSNTSYSYSGIEIKNCYFFSNTYYSWAGILICGSIDNWYIHDNYIHGPSGSEQGPSDPIFITTLVEEDIIEKIVIENNTIIGGYHNALMVQAANGGTVRNIVFRKNYVSNINHTNIGFALGVSNSLIEDNVILNAGSICTRDGDGTTCTENENGTEGDQSKDRMWKYGIALLGSSGFIVRNNILNNNGVAFAMDVDDSNNHRIYNNTVFGNTRGVGINASRIYGNWFLNNIFYNNTLDSAQLDYELQVETLDETDYHNYFENNYVYSTFNSKFKNNADGTLMGTITTIDAASSDANNNIATNPNLSILTPTCVSCVETGGRYLTLANGTGSNSTELIVYDASFIYSGYGISTETGDIITVGSATATVASISGNTITLVSPISWENNAEIRLSKQGVKIGTYRNYHCGNMVSGAGPHSITTGGSGSLTISP